MAELIIDGLSESDGVVFHTLPASTYDGRVVSAEITEAGAQSKNPGSKMIKIGVKASSDEASVTVFKYYQLPDPSFMDAEQMRKAVAAIKRLWLACGLDATSNNIDTDDLLHCDLQVQIGVEKYNGQDQNRLIDVIIRA